MGQGRMGSGRSEARTFSITTSCGALEGQWLGLCILTAEAGV